MGDSTHLDAVLDSDNVRQWDLLAARPGDVHLRQGGRILLQLRGGFKDDVIRVMGSID